MFNIPDTWFSLACLEVNAKCVNAKCVNALDVAAMTGRVPQPAAASPTLPAASEHIGNGHMHCQHIYSDFIESCRDWCFTPGPNVVETGGGSKSSGQMHCEQIYSDFIESCRDRCFTPGSRVVAGGRSQCGNVFKFAAPVS